MAKLADESPCCYTQEECGHSHGQPREVHASQKEHKRCDEQEDSADEELRESLSPYGVEEEADPCKKVDSGEQKLGA